MPEKVLRYEQIMFICWEITGRDLNPKKVNPIIKKFHDQLNDFFYEVYPFKIVPTAVDEFVVQEISGSLLIGSYMVRWEIIDLDGETAMYRKNNDIRPLLTREMMKVQVKGEIRGSRRIVMRMINSRFSDEIKEGIWPGSKPQVLTF